MATPTSGASGASNQAILWAGIIGSVVFAGSVAFVTMREEPETVPPADAVTTAQSAEPAVVVETPSVTEQTTGSATTADSAAMQTATPQAATENAAVDAAPLPIAPTFDVVRVDADGNAVIAGQAAPGATVVLRLNGETLDTVTADSAGNFVAMLAIEPSDLARVLSLEVVGVDGTSLVGADSVLIAPFAAQVAQVTADIATGAEAVADVGAMAAGSIPETASDVAAAATGTDTSAAAIASDPLQNQAAPSGSAAADPQPSVVPTTDIAANTVAPAEGAAAQTGQDATAQTPAQTELASAQANADATGAAAPQAPAVLIASHDGIRVAQGGDVAGGANVQLDAITYDDQGEVTLAGRGPADAELRFTLDDQAVGKATIDTGGQWSIPLSGVAAGTYTLRIEQLDVNGGVAATVQTPFLREDPARIRDNPMLADPRSSVITVQRGFTLWGIAEANFGNGILYVQIFQENRADIRDPDLIYPGQIFALPDLPRTVTAP